MSVTPRFQTRDMSQTRIVEAIGNKKREEKRKTHIAICSRIYLGIIHIPHDGDSARRLTVQ